MISNKSNFQKSKLINKCLITIEHYDIANLMYFMFNKNFICTNILKNNWYYYDKKSKIWIHDEVGRNLRLKINKEIYNIFSEYKSSYYNKLRKMELRDDNDDDIYNDYKTEKKYIEKDIKNVDKLIKKLSNTNYKNNIMKECKYLFYNDMSIIKLKRILNKTRFNSNVIKIIINYYDDTETLKYFKQ